MHSPVRHGRQRTPTARGLVFRFIGITVAVGITSTLAVVGYAVTSISSTFHEAAVDIGGESPPPPPPFLGAIEGGFNLLIVGSDNDEDQGDEYGERDAVLNDVNILVHVAADHRNAVVVSLPRDMMMPQPECDASDAVEAQPLNAAWARGGENGLGCVVAAVRSLTGLDIPYAMETSFNGVIAMSNAVGGVDVCVTDVTQDDYTGLYLEPGHHVLVGRDALAFLRTRHGVGDGSDLTRIGSQQQYLASLLRTIKSTSTLSDPVKVYGLAQAVAQNITPSTSLRGADTLISLALALKDIDLSRVVFVSYPVTAWVDDPNRVQPNEELAAQLVERIASDQAIALDAGAITSSSTVGDTADPASPAAPAAPPASSSPDVIEGLKGQTAAEQTCANPFSG
ncbi:LytR family transcriptional regulator [Herbiconiux sp. SALV-R1]|uniref:LCP family protein n=1 Tax=Herbiconiux sp. SALV-R1 TaxID=2735133 RepID=UPI00149203EE|nr:LCP family protein [Herbiconiux sp. SALV-R1]QJU54414.1 LytR family transcriptional regulator [Herbiconiux sp. SALV-R1]